MADFVDSIMDHLNAGVLEGVRVVVSEIHESVREEVSVPVGHSTGPRGGLLVIRSKPGEAPRKDRGDYQNSWGQSVESNGDQVEGTVFTDDVRAAYFTKGTARMEPRPHAEPSFQRIAPTTPQRISEALADG